MVVRELVALLGFKVDKGSEKEVEGSLGKITKGVKAVGAFFAAGVVAQGFKSMIDAASDAAEVTNKLGAVFGDLTDEMLEFSDATANEIGQSRAVIQGMSADIGALLKPMLGTTEAAAEMAQGVTGLAFDIASFQNLEPNVALDKLRAGLVGSSEPLLTLGIDVREAALAQFALEQGITKSTKAMTTAEKTSLRYNLILQRLTEQGAVGDAAKTADGFANAQRGLAGAFQDLQADIGAVFLPTAADFVVTMRDLARSMSGPLVRAAKVVQAVFSAIWDVASLIAEGFIQINDLIVFMAKEFLGLEESITQVVIILGVLVAILGLPIVLLGLIGFAIYAVIDDLIAMGEGGNSVIGGLIEEFNYWLEQVGSIAGAIKEILITAITFWFDVSREKVEEFFNLIAEIPKRIADAFKTVGSFFGDKVADLFFGANEGVNAATGPATVAAGAATTAAAGRPNVSSNQNTKVEINVTSNKADPAAVASEAAERFESSQERLNRRTLNQLTPSPQGA